jgi:hypothetical protein
VSRAHSRNTVRDVCCSPMPSASPTERALDDHGVGLVIGVPLGLAAGCGLSAVAARSALRPRRAGRCSRLAPPVSPRWPSPRWPSSRCGQVARLAPAARRVVEGRLRSAHRRPSDRQGAVDRDRRWRVQAVRRSPAVKTLAGDLVRLERAGVVASVELPTPATRIVYSPSPLLAVKKVSKERRPATPAQELGF